MGQVVIRIADLPLLSPAGRGPIPGERLLEGRAFGLGHLTLVLGETPPGQGTRLHRHDVEEVIIVHAGRGAFTLGETTVEAGAGEVVIIPPGVPHHFVNSARSTLYHTDVFATDTFALEVIEEAESS